MTAQTWIWMHGSSATVDFPADFPELSGSAQVPFRSIVRSGEGLQLSPQLTESHSVFIPLATPQLLDDVFMRVTGFSLLYQTTDAVIDSIDLFDGTKPIATFPVGWSGGHQVFDGTNTLAVSPAVDVVSGVVAVLRVTFARSSQPQTGAIFGSVVITAAGLRFAAGETRLQRFLRNIAALFTGK